MPTRNVTCTTGFCGVVRNLKGAEANMLADKAAARRLRTFDNMLEACWLEVNEPGPLAELYIKDGKVQWEKVLLGDRFEIILAIRVATMGSNYAFPHKCESCGETFETDLDLDRDLRRQPYSAKAIEAYRTGGVITEKLPDGKPFTFRIANGATEREAAKRAAKKKDEAVTVAISERIVSIEGIGDEKQAIRTYLEEVDMPDIYEISNTIDEHEGGIVTDIEIECPECGADNLVRLPFVGDFWISREKRRKRAVGEV